METVLKAISDWIKSLRTAAIMSNLSGLFDDEMCIRDRDVTGFFFSTGDVYEEAAHHNAVFAVSYTHLEVYKRQVLHAAPVSDLLQGTGHGRFERSIQGIFGIGAG